MSTQFPSFAPKTTNPLWFSVGEPGDDEAELRALEAKYRKWVSFLIYSYFWGQYTEVLIKSENVYLRRLITMCIVLSPSYIIVLSFFLKQLTFDTNVFFNFLDEINH